ncbi:MAG: hypothetical protein JXA20_15485, partial [Spirochaetes bacterium]|nr:hypothetical protein [Spirochaetota bacterium]
MKHYKKLVFIAAIIACGIITSCGAGSVDDRGLMLSPKPNEAPVADAGTDRNVYAYAGSASLDGSMSYDPE